MVEGADTTLSPARHTVVLAAGLVGTVLMGCLVAVQSRVNGDLAPLLVPPAVGAPTWDGPATAALAAGLDTAILSFVIGWVIVMAGSAASPRGRRSLRVLGAALRDGRLRWWQTLGGLAGATLVTSQGVAVPVLGVAVFTVTIVAGVTVAGLLVDRLGLSPNGVRPLTARRVVGAALAVVGVGLSVAGGLDGAGAASVAVGTFVAAVGFALVAGAGTSLQQAVNGHVAARSGSPWVAGVVNFTAGLLLLVPVRLATVGTALPAPAPEQWWLYASGPIGVTYIVLAAVLVRTLGVLVLGLGNTAGQLIGSITLDELYPTAVGRPGVLELAAAVVIFAAVALAASRPRSRSPLPAPAV